MLANNSARSPSNDPVSGVSTFACISPSMQPLGGALGLNNGAFPGSTANRILANEPRTYGVAATFRF